MHLAIKIQFFKRISILFLFLAYFQLGSSIEIFGQGQDVTYSVENFFIHEGLPVIRIYDTTQDHEGQIWVCTETGLFSFNGAEFELELDFGEQNYYPKKILFDNNQNIWLINYKHKHSHFPTKEYFELKIYSSDLKKVDSKTYVGEIIGDINSICQNQDGVLFFQADGNVYLFDQELKIISLDVPTNCYFYNDKKFSVLSDSTDVLIFDSNTNKLVHRINDEKIFFVDKYKEDLLFQFETGEYVLYNNKNHELTKISEKYESSPYFNYCIGENDIIWSISRNWLQGFNLRTKKNETLEEDYFKSGSYLTSIFIDQEQNIWIGSNQGLYKLSSSSNKLFDKSLPLGKSTRALLELEENKLFISTYNGDFIYDVKSKNVEELSSTDTKFAAIKKGDFYYTCSEEVLRKVRLSDNKVITERSLESELNQIFNPPVLLLSPEGDLLMKQSHSLRLIDENLNFKILYQDDSCQFRNFQIIEEEYYLSTTNGLKVLNLTFEVVDEYFSDIIVTYVHKDKIKPNIFWLTTPSFLIKLDTNTEGTIVYDSDSGFLNSIFTSIQEDDNGSLWLPSYAGLNKINKKTEEIKVYMVGDGVTNNEFNNYSTTNLSSGEFVFGGISGLTFVDSKIFDLDNIYVPEIKISECIKINQTDRVDNTQKVNEENKIIIEESDILINIKLAHYSYKNLSSKIFRYRVLKPSENDTIVPWVNLKSNVLQLGKFPYGTYSLEFEAISRSGDKLSDTNKIKLEYVTPFMRTSLFKACSLLFIGGIVYLIIQVRSHSLIQQKIALEKEVDIRTIQIQRQKEELEKMNNTKDKLFSILAHDLKSPLITLKNISGKINYLIQKNQPDRILELGKTIEDKVSNLSIFLDNLLNWSLQQRGHITYNPINLQLHEITVEILNIYEDHIEEKNLKVANEIPAQAHCFADKNSIHAVLRNLISNSIKYSPNGEVITLKFETGKSYHIYSVNDNGKGIEQKVVDSLYRNGNIQSEKGTNDESGTGLGLLISKELIELNKGHIKFLSNSNKGTNVEIHLPVGKIV